MITNKFPTSVIDPMQDLAWGMTIGRQERLTMDSVHDNFESLNFVFKRSYRT